MAKTVFILFILLVSIITVCFFWKETSHLSLEKKINFEKFESYFASIGAIGASLSLFLLYKQVKIANDAHVATYEPEIKFIDKEFIVEFPEYGYNDKKPSYLMVFDEKGELVDLNNQLEILNLGNNLALNVSFRFRQKRAFISTLRFHHICSWKPLDYQQVLPDIKAGQTLKYSLPTVYNTMLLNAKTWFDRGKSDLTNRFNTDRFYIILKYMDRTKKSYRRRVSLYIKLEEQDEKIIFKIFFN